MREFILEKDYYDECIKIYKKRKIKIETGLTVLIGCNGAGKTTLIQSIKYQLEDNGINYASYDDLQDGRHHAKERAGFYQDFTALANRICSSEGENIQMNIADFASKIGKYCRDNANQDELWIFLDAVDSGLSIDNICEIKNDLFPIIFEMNSDKDIYIIASANAYELARQAKCFDTINGNYVEINSYEEYRNFVLDSRKQKDQRYK